MARRPMLPVTRRVANAWAYPPVPLCEAEWRAFRGEIAAAEAVILAALRLLPQTKVPSRLIAWTFAEKDVRALDRALARLTGKGARPRITDPVTLYLPPSEGPTPKALRRLRDVTARKIREEREAAQRLLRGKGARR